MSGRDFTVVKVGTDSSGRTIYMTRYMRSVWRMIVADPEVAPFADRLTIVQGAFMVRNGGGAADSAGYHDEAGCVDVRTWNLTATELDTFIRVARLYGWAFWRRDAAHGGMDPHAHGVLGTDQPLASGAAIQWQQYLNGRDGLASNGPDYEHRPHPLVTVPPKHGRDWLDMATEQELRTLVREETTAAVEKLLTTEQSNGKTLRENIRGGGNTPALVREVLAELRKGGKA